MEAEAAREVRVTVHAGSERVSGAIRCDEDRYVNLVEGVELGPATGLDLAIYRLTTNLRILLPPVAPPGWEVVVDDPTERGFRVDLTEREQRFEGPADDGTIPRLVSSAPHHTLSDAIECAARVARHRVTSARGSETDDRAGFDDV